MKQLLYIIGVPGVGKSTLVRRLVRGCPSKVVTVPYVAYTEYRAEVLPRVVQLGYDREAFSGTDALGMAAQNHVLALIGEEKFPYIIAEGDRLANHKFFTAMEDLGYQVTVVALIGPDEMVGRRLAARNRELGKQQNEQWLKTRHTKVDNLVEEWVHPEWIIDARLPVGAQADVLGEHPVVKRLKRIRRAVR